MVSKMERITYAAILRTDKCIIFGICHLDCITRSPHDTCKDKSVEGFLTNEYRFVDKYEAAKIAFKANQIDYWKVGQILTSEELWKLDSFKF